MKNVLFATTALVLTAGVASAELTFSGTAGAGVVQEGAGEDMRVWSGMDIAISATATTDSGMTVTVGDDIGGGELIDWDDDYAVDSQASGTNTEADANQDDIVNVGESVNSPAIGTPAVTITSGATTVVFDNNAVDHLDDDSVAGDVSVSTSMAGATVAVVLDIDQSSGTDYSISAGYTVAGVALSVSMQDDSNKIGASYTMGNITVGVSSDDDGAGTRTNELTASYVAGPATISFAADDQDAWSVGLGYTAGAMTVNFGTDQDSAWDANASYDLGGGVSARASVNEAEFMAAGINFSF
jgi:outer membrane protein OmpU